MTLLSFGLQRNCYIKNVVLFEENSILPLPGRSEASGVESVWGEVSQESRTNRQKSENNSGSWRFTLGNNSLGFVGKGRLSSAGEIIFSGVVQLSR